MYLRKLPTFLTLIIFCCSLSIPTVDSSLVDQLESPFTMEELAKAASSMQGGKCSGPDGYPVEFYKKFLNKLGPLLIDMYTESFKPRSL